MTAFVKRIFFTLAALLIMLPLLPACNGDDDLPAGAASRVKVKLLNKDCMGVVIAILDPRYVSWGQPDYRINNETYNGAVWVQEGESFFSELALAQEYYVDIQSIENRCPAYCKRGPGPPQKMAAIYKVY